MQNQNSSEKSNMKKVTYHLFYIPPAIALTGYRSMGRSINTVLTAMESVLASKQLVHRACSLHWTSLLSGLYLANLTFALYCSLF